MRRDTHAPIFTVCFNYSTRKKNFNKTFIDVYCYLISKLKAYKQTIKVVYPPDLMKPF